MLYSIDLRSYFTPAAIASVLKSLPKISTQIIDTVYTDRRTHPFPVIGIDEITKVLQTAPVIRRGTPAVPIKGESRAISYIEPAPIETSSFISAKKLNDLKLLDRQGLQYWINDEIADIRRIARWSTEALAAQSLTGSISYPMKVNGGYETYQVDFGTTLSYTPAVLWSASTTKISQILMDLVNVAKTLKKKGYGTKIVWLAGSSVFTALADKVLNLQARSDRFNAQVTDQSINIAGFQIQFASGFYQNPQTGATVDVIAPTKLCAVAADAPHRLYYCAIDDVDINLKALPFYAVPIKSDNPSGYNVIGKTKPLPVPVVNGICWATLTD